MNPTCTWTSTFTRGEMLRVYVRHLIHRLGVTTVIIGALQPILLLCTYLEGLYPFEVLSLVGTMTVAVVAMMCTVSIRFRLRTAFGTTSRITIVYTLADGRMQVAKNGSEFTFPFTAFTRVERISGYVMVQTSEGQLMTLHHADLPTGVRELLGVQGVVG